MPLKLLAKKSWHVYNADNVARVRRDEAEARAREADEERQQRAAESSQRAAQLRGDTLGHGADDSTEQAKWAAAERATGHQSTEAAPTVPVASARASTRRPRKRHGEDDTDFEMRMAKAHVEEEDGASTGRRQKTGAAAETERPLIDGRGNIDLFGQLEEGAIARAARPADPAPDAPSSSMRFADAAGGANALSAWYAGEKGPTPASKPSFSSIPSSSNKPRRPPISAPAGSLGADPLAAIRQGAAAVRALKQERQRETEERNQAMAVMVAEQEKERERERERRRHRRHREHHHRYHEERRRLDEDSDKDDVSSLDGFTLDDVKEKKHRDNKHTKEKLHHSYRDPRDGRDDRHSKTRDHQDRERRHHRDNKDRERSRHRHHRDRDDHSRSHREKARSKDRSLLSPRSRISAQVAESKEPGV